jgi:thiamine-monophosphate kinase
MSTEFSRIATYLRPLTQAVPQALALEDDAAVCPMHAIASMYPAECDLVATTDAIVTGVHFFQSDPPEAIAAKVLRVNLSDLAAMGATPYGFLLTCGYASWCSDAWMARFSQGLKEDIARFGIALLGGDSVTMPACNDAAWFSVTALGHVPSGQAMVRSGARVGDGLYVTGTIGDAALGLWTMQGQCPDGVIPYAEALRHRYWYPEPRIQVGEALRGIASSGMDSSDGLLAAVHDSAQASGVQASVTVDAVPLSPGAAAWVEAMPSAWMQVLRGGDDYELVFTCPPSKAASIDHVAARTDVRITQIGTIRAHTEGHTLSIRIPSGLEDTLATLHRPPFGYAHTVGS